MRNAIHSLIRCSGCTSVVYDCAIDETLLSTLLSFVHERNGALIVVQSDADLLPAMLQDDPAVRVVPELCEQDCHDAIVLTTDTSPQWLSGKQQVHIGDTIACLDTPADPSALVTALETMETAIENTDLEKRALERENAFLRKLRDDPLTGQGSWHDLHRILRSRSWRWTAPLRKTESTLRRLPRAIMRLPLKAGWLIWKALGSPWEQQVRSLRYGRCAHLWAPAASTPTPITNPSVTVRRGSPPVFPQFATVDVSIVIPAHDNSGITDACLRSIAEHTTGRYEVIVSVDASPDDTLAMLEKYEGITVVSSSVNRGFSVTCNRGAAKARGRSLFFLNNDTLVTEGWLEPLVHTMEEPSVGITGPQLIYPDGTLQDAGGIVWRDGRVTNVGRGEDPDDPRYGFRRDVDTICGAALMIDAHLFRSIGGFDAPRYTPGYYEDTDLCFHVRNLGRRVVYQPRSRIIHLEGATAGRDETKGIKRFQPIHRESFAQQWKQQLRHQPKRGSDPHRAMVRAERHILFIDHRIPTPDRDSGSLRTATMMELLIEAGHRVTLLPHDLHDHTDAGASLQEKGIEVLCRPCPPAARLPAGQGQTGVDSAAAFIRERGSTYDTVILSRCAVAATYLPTIRQRMPRAQIIFDTVDLHHRREQRGAKISNDNEALGKAKKTEKSELQSVRAADHTIVVSEEERSTLLRSVPSASVSVLSNIHPIRSDVPPYEDRSDLLFVGSFAHTPNVDAADRLLEEIWPRILEQLPNAVLHIVGSDGPAWIAKRRTENLHMHDHVSDLGSLMDRCCINLAPLRFGAGVKGKISGSLSCGLPTVTTTIGAEGMGLTDGENILIADDAEHFADAVVRLRSDVALWNRLSAAGLELAQTSFSVDRARGDLQSILEQLHAPTKKKQKIPMPA